MVTHTVSRRISSQAIWVSFQKHSHGRVRESEIPGIQDADREMRIKGFNDTSAQ